MRILETTRYIRNKSNLKVLTFTRCFHTSVITVELYRSSRMPFLLPEVWSHILKISYLATSYEELQRFY